MCAYCKGSLYPKGQNGFWFIYGSALMYCTEMCRDSAEKLTKETN